MIIVDANIIRGTKLGGPEDELLRTIRASRAERVAVPRIALEEVLAQRVLAYNRAHAATVDSAARLNIATPWKTVDGPDEYDPDRVREHWRVQYAHVAEVLETSIGAHQQALFREANLVAPCKLVGEKDKTGARDAAIWLTAVEYARQNPNETVYFVSRNTQDFGKHAGEIPQLAEDIAGMEDRFVLYTSLGDVLARFARKVRTTKDEVRELLSHPDGLEVIARRARLANMKKRIEALRFSMPVEQPVSRLSQSTRAVLVDVEDPRAYEIDGHKWFTATARWLISDQIPPSSSIYELLSWKTRVMASPTDHNVTILKSYGIEAAGPEDRPLFPSIDGTWIDDTDAFKNLGQVLIKFAKAISTVSMQAGDQPYHGDLPPEDISLTDE